MIFDIPQLTILILTFMGSTLGSLYWKRLSFFWRIIHIQFIFAFISELTGRVIIERKIGSTIPLFNVYILLEQLLLVSAAFIILKQYRKLYVGSLLLCELVWLADVTWNGLYELVLFSFLIGCVLITALFIVCLIRLTNTGRSIESRPLLWLSSAMVLYFGCDIPLFSIFDYLTRHKKFGFDLYAINQVLAIARYMLTLIGLYFAIHLPKQKTVAGI